MTACTVHAHDGWWCTVWETNQRMAEQKFNAVTVKWFVKYTTYVLQVLETIGLGNNKCRYWKVCQWEGAVIAEWDHLLIRRSTLSLQTAWTSFYASLEWKIATARPFILNRDTVTDMMPATPPEPGSCAVQWWLSLVLCRLLHPQEAQIDTNRSFLAGKVSSRVHFVCSVHVKAVDQQ